jgi:hypothetical protein
VRRALVAGFIVAVGALSAGATANVLRVTAIHSSERPAVVRFTVTFSGGRLQIADIFASDPGPFQDGASRIRVRRATIPRERTTSAGGITLRVGRVGQQLSLRFQTAPLKFKYLGYRLLRRPQRLVVELWKSTPPAAPMRRARDGCLLLSQWTNTAGTVRVAGSERNLFEHMFLVQLRNARGGVVGKRSVAAAAGRWSTKVAYHVSHRQAGTLEAVDLSEGDGSLVCLAQVKVTLRH